MKQNRSKGICKYVVEDKMYHGTVGNVHLSLKVQNSLLLHSAQDCGLRGSYCHRINVQYRIYTLPK